MSGILKVLFPGWAHSFTSCQLMVKDEHWVKPWLGSTSHSDITSTV